LFRSDTEIEIRASADRLPGILISVDREEKVVKNRLHLDFRPDDQAAEVARFLELGARHVDVGQTGDEPWVVLADPEGNEFCILSSPADRACGPPVSEPSDRLRASQGWTRVLRNGRRR